MVLGKRPLKIHIVIVKAKLLSRCILDLTAVGFVYTSSSEGWACQHPAMEKWHEVPPFSENLQTGSRYLGFMRPDSSQSTNKHLMVTSRGGHVTTGKKSRLLQATPHSGSCDKC